MQFGSLLHHTRHDLDEVARPVAVVELPLQDFVPGILACTRRTWDTKDIGTIGSPGTSPRLHSRGFDLLIGDHVKNN